MAAYGAARGRRKICCCQTTPDRPPIPPALPEITPSKTIAKRFMRIRLYAGSRKLPNHQAFHGPMMVVRG